ncbi:MAG: polysaccharide biosynthesis protein [Bacteroidales bacterium]|nr:polysaccharide biosynthesis protein [Candidatus Hennigimonas equi]
MKDKIDRFLASLANIQYLSAWVILLNDTFLCAIGTSISILAIEWFIGRLIAPQYFFLILLVAVPVSILVFLILKTYRQAIRHTTLSDVGLLAIAVLLKTLVTYLFLFAILRSDFGLRFLFFCGLVDAFVSFAFLVCMRTLLIFLYGRLRLYFRSSKNLKRVLVYGTSDKSVSMLIRLQKSTHFHIIGFLEYGDSDIKVRISDLPVYVFNEARSVLRLKDSLSLDGILFAVSSDAQAEQKRLVDHAIKAGISVFLAPEIDEVEGGKVARQTVREIKIEDLLGRKEIQISMGKIKEELSGKTIMVTGAAGSIGSELCRQIASMGVVHKLILFDNAETPMHNLRLELEENYPDLHFVPVIGDVRLKPRLDYAFRNWRPQIVFHAAAYKHVPLMEDNPCEAVLVNAVGSRQVADKCIEYDVEKMVMISTDKAVNPTNIMGCTKRLAEIYVQALGLAVESGHKVGKTQFVTTRFGNVLGSNGSVIPRFRDQILNGGPVTVTHPDITRFFMTIPEACRLVMEAACLGKGNQIFVFDMGESVKISDLATRMIELAGFRPGVDIAIQYTGLRPGEKLYEEVLATTENTDPTPHKRIRVARVRDYSYDEAVVAIDRLENLSRQVDIPEMVKYMKTVVPEYVSNNSVFTKFDK